MTFEKLSSASDGFYFRITQALELFKGVRFLVLNLYLSEQFEVPVVRLFKLFFSVAE